MVRKKFLPSASAVPSLLLLDSQVTLTWVLIALQVFSLDAVLPVVYTVKALLIRMFEIAVRFYAGTVLPVVATISVVLTDLLLMVDHTATKTTETVCAVLTTVLAVCSPHVQDFVSFVASSFFWSATTLTKASASVLRLGSVFVLKSQGYSRSTFQSLTNVTSIVSNDYVRYAVTPTEEILPIISDVRLMSIWAVPIMVVLSWLSRPFNTTDKIRADYFADVLSRKCMIHREHNTARLLGLIYLLGSCAILRGALHSSARYSSFAAAIFLIWSIRPAINTRIVESLDARRAIFGFDSIIFRVKEFCEEHVSGKSRKEERIKELNEDLKNTKQLEKVLQESNRDLYKRNDVLAKSVQDLQAQVHKLKKKRDQEYTQEYNKIKSQNAHWNHLHQQDLAKSAGLVAQVNVLEQQCATLLKAKTEAQFEVEILKCTTSSINQDKSSVVSDLAIPFVLILVDGDAYSWSDSHFAQTHYPPGASAAQSIKSEVQNYLIANKDRCPVQSRIVARVFQNTQTRHSSGKMRAGDFLLRYQCDFPRDFTQSMPLFDYIDSGTGKERVDSKIQESTHLFISNPSCHAIFLAAATDNGFARMLEQYAYDDAMRKKIILIHPGYIIREINALGFEAIEWPTVFQKRAMPIASRLKADSISAAIAQRKREEQIAVVKMMVEVAPRLDVYQELCRSGASGMLRRNLDPNMITAKDQGAYEPDVETLSTGDITP